MHVKGSVPSFVVFTTRGSGLPGQTFPPPSPPVRLMRAREGENLFWGVWPRAAAPAEPDPGLFIFRSHGAFRMPRCARKGRDGALAWLKFSVLAHPPGCGTCLIIDRRSSRCFDLRLLSDNPPGCLADHSRGGQIPTVVAVGYSYFAPMELSGCRAVRGRAGTVR